MLIHQQIKLVFWATTSRWKQLSKPGVSAAAVAHVDVDGCLNEVAERLLEGPGLTRWRGRVWICGNCCNSSAKDASGPGCRGCAATAAAAAEVAASADHHKKQHKVLPSLLPLLLLHQVLTASLMAPLLRGACCMAHSSAGAAECGQHVLLMEMKPRSEVTEALLLLLLVLAAPLVMPVVP